MDESAEAALRLLQLPRTRIIPLAEIENGALRKVKQERSRGEYCWTLTPFLPAHILERNPQISRVTYLDADLFLFRPPTPIFDAMGAADSLITEHAFDPRYEQSETAGRFCVQFMPFRQSQRGLEILSWWQERCLEWCFARHEKGKFGDQKYLESWPELFGDSVRILQDRQLALAPWNSARFLSRETSDFRPVFFHFHGFRLVDPTHVRLFTGYDVGPAAKGLYDEYLRAWSVALSELNKHEIPPRFFPEPKSWRLQAYRMKERLLGRAPLASLVP